MDALLPRAFRLVCDERSARGGTRSGQPDFFSPATKTILLNNGATLIVGGRGADKGTPNGDWTDVVKVTVSP